jgi:phosphatidylglycerol:prolipoprotein diacylglycerol transferase
VLPYFQIGGFSLPAYGVIVAAAVVSASWLAIARAPRYGIETHFMIRVTAYTVLTAVVGCRLGDLAIHPSFYWHSPEALLHSGGTFLFGFLAAALVVAAFAIHSGVSGWTLADCGAPAFALGIAVGRLGCFAAGCDYGKPSNLPWSVTFHDPAAAQLGGVPLGIPLHPSQLYESFYEFALLALLTYLSRRPHRPGRIIWTFAISYSVGRFFLEFLRGDMDRGFWGPFSTSQWLSVFLLLLLLFLHQVKATHGRPAVTVRSQAPDGAMHSAEKVIVPRDSGHEFDVVGIKVDAMRPRS